MAIATVTQKPMETCELCGGRFEPNFKGRIEHLKASHAAYARGVLFRVVAPVVCLVSLLALAAMHAPASWYPMALVMPAALLLSGKARSRAERTKAGAKASIGVSRFLKEGGMPFVLAPVVLVAIYLLVR